MKKVIYLYIFLAIILLVLFYSYHIRRKDVESETILSECQTINVSGSYILSSNITPQKQCFTISADNVILDGAGYTISGINGNDSTGIYASSVKNVIVKNISIENYESGIFFGDSYNVSIINNTLDRNLQGILLINTTNSYIGNNSIRSSSNIGLIMDDGSDGDILRGNMISSSLNPIFLRQSADDDVESNNFLNNLDPIIPFYRNLTIGYVNQPIDFYTDIPSEISSCASCNYSITLSPNNQDFSLKDEGNLIHGQFVPSKVGIYSVEVTYLDVHDNYERTKYSFLVSPTGEATSEYYIRGIDPTHGQAHSLGAYKQDAGSLLSSSPDEIESRSCTDWVQISPDELPTYLLGVVDKINFSLTYRENSSFSPQVGVQKIVTYDYSLDQSVNVSDTNNFLVRNYFNFSVNWPINYYWQWYWQAIKIVALSGSPTVTIDPLNPDKADFSYIYSKAPAILSKDNEGLNILSATMSSENSTNASIFLRGNGILTNLAIKMPIPNKEYSASVNGKSCNDYICNITEQENGSIYFSLHLSGINEIKIV